jgi:nucleotide-binding universal stress UspA family protein
MSQTFKSIVHPTDFDKAGAAAFAHGLKLALATKGRFAIVHNMKSEVEDEARILGFPGVRDTLASWGLLDLSVPRESVEDALGIRVSKIDLGGVDTVEGLVEYIDRHEGDLVVLATHARDGLPRWLKGSIAESIARRSGVATLFLPHGTRGFVEPASGDLHLFNILIPVDRQPAPKAALAAVATLVDLLDAQAARLHFLHVGRHATAPELALPSWLGARTERLDLEGPVVETIVAAADRLDADLTSWRPRAGTAFSTRSGARPPKRCSGGQAARFWPYRPDPRPEGRHPHPGRTIVMRLSAVIPFIALTFLAACGEGDGASRQQHRRRRPCPSPWRHRWSRSSSNGTSSPAASRPPSTWRSGLGSAATSRRSCSPTASSSRPASRSS